MDMLTPTEQLFKVFADKNRMRILLLLARRKMCVCELAQILGVTQPSVSRHLKRMKQAGLIGTEKDGFWTNYFLRKSSKAGEDVLGCIRHLLRNDAVIKADAGRAKTVDRTGCCI
jgi:ArsR family transcriptional regulator